MSRRTVALNGGFNVRPSGSDFIFDADGDVEAPRRSTAPLRSSR